MKAIPQQTPLIDHRAIVERASAFERFDISIKSAMVAPAWSKGYLVSNGGCWMIISESGDDGFYLPEFTRTLSRPNALAFLEHNYFVEMKGYEAGCKATIEEYNIESS